MKHLTLYVDRIVASEPVEPGDTVQLFIGGGPQDGQPLDLGTIIVDTYDHLAVETAAHGTMPLRLPGQASS